MLRLKHLAALLTFAALAVTSARAQEPKPPVPAQYAATAIGQAGATAGRTFGMNIYIQGTTTNGERDELLGLLKQKGQNGLVSKLEDSKDLGRVAPLGGVGTGMRFVRIIPKKDGGLHIVMATNRPISFPELWNGTRSRDYEIGIVTLDVDKNGKGSGSFAPACKVKFNKKGELEVETYGQKPFRLANVYREK
ncbi:MAG TPA: hypothetical protein VMT75_12665 [Candidatus Saccharimonadales bacterium]|nr:hypothetical protein [Candidatus Saccharimonadales bacterium]